MCARKYIYDRADWPELQYDAGKLQEALAGVYHARGKLFGALNVLGFKVQESLLLSSVSDEIITSSAIEGEKLDMTSVRSSVARRLGLEIIGLTGKFPDHYTDGVVEMALDASQNYLLPLTEERLFGWHAALFPTGRSGARRIVVGAFRTAEMEIVSGPFGKEKLHYRAPAPGRVPGEMKSFLEWIESGRDIDPFVKTGMAHLRFEAIHPFDDGNGRIGRAIADLLLARADNSPQRFYSLSAQFLKEQKAYYDALESATKISGNIDDWLLWFLNTLVHSMQASEQKIEAAMQKAAFFEKYRSIPMNERQLSMVNRLLDGFIGKLTTEKWGKMTKCSHDTALRDINDLIKKDVLIKEDAGGRSASYTLKEY